MYWLSARHGLLAMPKYTWHIPNLCLLVAWILSSLAESGYGQQCVIVVEYSTSMLVSGFGVSGSISYASNKEDMLTI